jgi:hypothetical protein
MKWSKLKDRIEEQFADSVRGHAAIHITRYGPGLSSAMTRGWLTWDGEEILNFSTINWLKAAHEIQNTSGSTFDATRDYLHEQGDYSRFDFTDALEEYLSLSIGSALQSNNMLIRALAMLDRRVGKRRLKGLQFDTTEYPLVKQLYTLRCAAEGILPTDTTASGNKL